MKIEICSPQIDATVLDENNEVILEWHVKDYAVTFDIHALLVECGSLSALVNRITAELAVSREMTTPPAFN